MKRKIVLYVILALMVVAGGGIGYYYWYEGSHYVSTEDARIDGDTYRVMPRISGKLLSLQIKQGDTVVADQIVGQQDTNNLATGLLDNASLRAPITGTVTKTLAREGEVLSPGQPIALVVDKSNLYISANIEETYISRLQSGETAEFTVDSFPGHTLTGKIIEIGEGTVSSFSLMPSLSSSGNFTKVTQRIPIKLSIDDQQGLSLSPGMNVVLKIQAKG
ncbi:MULTISPECIES: HlyD family efflux transporter periplasmic adaptor subunit [Desulfosporosinus]|uniref:Multidrug resistance efflux pump n=1 Tax=Desulfosporosinus meridiei (strain ATCC BAA-275 / DSM 13257 / KCTC 12902 / NCIMB 13706 / S10) TaxID=768704 RepID=J7IXH9_DESMD|nr:MULTISPECIES: HlyD family efflux transporter periplasmic adaptor subunit [Desulfosporosinus]AFQ43803.1 multidrug resistance efflux pump [Desulfosporosinus meridiei DSM 13257]MCB8815370.1 HlyD family efflux transporter periplasmic adaptor subunit [Desulfosporosinus sp. SRJS8]